MEHSKLFPQFSILAVVCLYSSPLLLNFLWSENWKLFPASHQLFLVSIVAEFIEEWNWYLFSLPKENETMKLPRWRRWRRITRRQMPNGWTSWENFRLIYLKEQKPRNERKKFLVSFSFLSLVELNSGVVVSCSVWTQQRSFDLSPFYPANNQNSSGHSISSPFWVESSRVNIVSTWNVSHWTCVHIFWVEKVHGIIVEC